MKYVRIIAVLILISTCSYAEDKQAIGFVTEFNLPVSISRQEKSITPTSRMPLYAGDKFITGKDGWLLFSFNKGSQFRLSEDAEASIDELSSGDEESPTVNLVIGFLRSVVKGIKGNAPIVHTPTAVAGVRGTEFDTVVSIDSGTVITVDEGSVEADTDNEKAILNAGLTAELNSEGKISEATKAVDKNKRDWTAWQYQKAEKFIQVLPEIMPKYRHRFESGAKRFQEWHKLMVETTENLSSEISEIRKAKAGSTPKMARQSAKRLITLSLQFKAQKAKFRRVMNRLQNAVGNSYWVDKFIEKNNDRIPADNLQKIAQDFQAVSGERNRINEIFGQTIKIILATDKELIEIKKEFVNFDKF